MDAVCELAIYFDFYGNLLTDKQRDYFDLYYNKDLSLSEIAEGESISRQAVRDALVRAEAILRDTEEKTGLVAKYFSTKDDVTAILDAAFEIFEVNRQRVKNGRIHELAQLIVEKAENIRV